MLVEKFGIARKTAIGNDDHPGVDFEPPNAAAYLDGDATAALDPQPAGATPEKQSSLV